MMNFDWIGATGIAVISSYVTLAIVAETQPIIDEDGYEDYTIPGYLLLAGAFVIKWSVKTTLRLIGYNKKREIVRPSVEDDEESSEYELVV